jgi:hypothetical protein
MKTKFKISILVIVVLSLFISTGWGAPRGPKKATPTSTVVTKPSATVQPSKVIGVIVSTTNPVVGQRIKVTVTGVPNYGDCLIHLSKGDGSLPIYLYGDSKSFPYTASNNSLWPKYDKVGTYILSIMGSSSSSCKCSGTVSVMIKVRPKFKMVKPTKITMPPSKVTGVLVSTTTPEVGEKIKVTVLGTPKDGDCQLFISYGDGTTPWLLYGNSKNFPFAAAENLWPKYNKPGTYELIVKGGSTASCDCSGQASVTIKVKPTYEIK